MYKFPLLLVSLIVFIFSCKKKDEANTNPVKPVETPELPTDTAGNAVNLTTFPLKPGYCWTYEVREQTTPEKGEKSAIHTYIIKDSITAEIIKNGIHYFSILRDTCFVSLLRGDEFSYCSNVYYVNQPGGLYEVSSTDSFNIDSSSLSLKFPTQLNESWTCINDTKVIYNEPEGSSRKWESYVKINTAAGSFDCIKLSMHGCPYCPGGFYGISYYAQQYYSAKGLVREVQIMSNTTTAHSFFDRTRVINLIATNF